MGMSGFLLGLVLATPPALPQGCQALDTAALQVAVGASYIIEEGVYGVDEPEKAYQQRVCGYRAGMGEAAAARFEVIMTVSNASVDPLQQYREQGWGIDRLEVRPYEAMDYTAVMAEWDVLGKEHKRAVIWQADSILFTLQMSDAAGVMLSDEAVANLARLVTESVTRS